MGAATRALVSVGHPAKTSGRGRDKTRFVVKLSGGWKATGSSEEEACERLSDALQRHRKYDGRLRVLFCGDGTVISVQYAGEGWEYRMHRKEQKIASSCMGSWKSEDEALDAVRKHAEASFGGVVHLSE